MRRVLVGSISSVMFIDSGGDHGINVLVAIPARQQDQVT